MTVRRWLARLRSDTTPAGAGWQRAGRAGAVGRDCGPRPARSCDRWRTPPEDAGRLDREGTCTTALRCDDDDPAGTAGRTRRGLGSARSSRETVAALGAPRLEHGASGAGAHAMAKTVLLGTAQIVGLVGALHAAALLVAGPTGRQRRQQVGLWQVRRRISVTRGSTDRPPGYGGALAARNTRQTTHDGRRFDQHVARGRFGGHVPGC